MKHRWMLLFGVLLAGGSLCYLFTRSPRANIFLHAAQTIERRPESSNLLGINPANRPRVPTPKRPPRNRLWDRAFLSRFKQVAVGDSITFELVGGETAAGNIGYLVRTNGEVIYLSGKLTAPEGGRFFFQKQTKLGVAGEFVGVVEFPSAERAYRIEPTGPDGNPQLVERALDEVLCLRLPFPGGATTNRTRDIPPLNPGDFPPVPIPGYQNGIPVLESLHGASAVIYLDFQGGYTPTWGGVTYAAAGMSNSVIRQVWRRVAEDFMPFNINVTTDLKTFQSAPEGSRQHVAITPTTTPSPEAGGTAYVGSFNYTGDTPCWVFVINDDKACAEACSHEIGHTMNLARHEGQDHNGTHHEYYQGQGLGDTAWAPIMGVGYYRNVSQWCHGEYLYADNTEDELAMLVTLNNAVTYRADDTGDTLATSRYLELYPDYSASAEGVVERTADTDAFQFTTDGGSVSLRADPVSLGPDLALAVGLYDANDLPVVTNNPQDTLWAALDTDLTPGTYTFRVTGAGRGDPLTNGFSSYASLGYYSITGLVANARLPDRFAIPEHSTNGTVVGTLSARNATLDPLAYAIVYGNTSNTFALDDFGVLTIADNTLLDYTTLASQTQFPVQFELFVTITDLLDPSLNETNRRVVVAILPVLGPPVITQQPQSLTVIASDAAGFSVGAYTDQATYDWLNYQWFFDGTALPGATAPTLFIADAQAANAGDYTVVITNSLGAVTSLVATLTVTPEPPQFTSQPASQAVLVGSRVAFFAVAAGTEPIAYQWQFNGADLEGQTNTSLILPAAGLSNTGTYRVVASNAAGVTASASAELSLTTLLAWGSNDSGQTNVPVGLTNVVLISAGARHNLGLLRDGTVVAWGWGPQTNVPPGLAGIIGIAAGGSHSLALKNDGTVTAWGDDAAGQTAVPSGLTNVVAIAAGGNHSLALTADGTVTAWGLNTNGQCNVPTGLGSVVAIAAGSNFSLALKVDGTVSGWGDNSLGQLSVPANLKNVVAIAAGAEHSLALKADGTVVGWGSSWGNNQYGQAVVPAGLQQVVAITAGGFHSLALRADGSVVGWGAGSSINSAFPQLGQAAIPAGLAGVGAIAAGALHSLVLIGDGSPFITEPPISRAAYKGTEVILHTAATGALPLTFQWQLDGTNLPGATGPSLLLDGATNAGAYQVIVSNAFGVALSAPARLLLLPRPPLLAWGANNFGQTNVPAGLSNVVQIAAGAQHNLALSRDGTVVGWGSGPQTNVPPGLSGIIGIAAGGTHSLALKNDGTVSAWGNNAAGQTNVPSDLTNVTAIAAGGNHSLALRADGTVAAWGLNTNGQCNVPIRLSEVVAIAAGSNFSLALKVDGTVSGWGDNSFGQLKFPANLSNVVAIAAGAEHSLALKADGTVVGWGGNPYGQAAVPAGLAQVVAIAAGGFHSLALRADGSVIGWGAGVSGDLGFPPLLGQASIPVLVQVGGIAAIAAGGLHSLVLVGDGAPFITEPLVSGLAYINSQVILHTAATGGLPLSFQWQLDGTNLPGATGRALLLNDATNAGEYQVVISNSFGVAVSGPAELMLVPEPPGILVQPPSQFAYLGSRLNLQVLAYGTKPLSYQWRFDGEDLPAATNASLTLDDLTFAQSGAYSVLVSNASGVVSSAKAMVQVAQVAAWGDNTYGQTNVPPGLAGVVQVAGGDFHSLALRADGTVVAWGAMGRQGFNNYGQTLVSPNLTNAIAVAAGRYHSVALKADGTVTAWGAGSTNSNSFFAQYGQTMIPAGLTEVVAIAAGAYHSAALTSDGRVIVWGGQPGSSVANVPFITTNVVGIASTAYAMLALKADGSVLFWGSAGAWFSGPNLVALGPEIALRGDGRVASPNGTPPFGVTNVVEIAGGGIGQFLARRGDGTVVTWGNINQFGLGAVASRLTNAIAIGCGFEHSLAALGDGSVQITVQPCNRKVDAGGKTLLSVIAAGSPPLQYQWRFNGLDLPDATNFWLRLTNLLLTDAGDYSVLVSNPFQAVTSRVATLVVRPASLPLSLALDAPNLPWVSQGNTAWLGQTNITHDGIGAAQSGGIYDSQQSLLETTVSGPGTLTFWWKVSSEQWFDFLNFAVNGQVLTNISGEVDWQFQQIAIPPGTALLAWYYAKDSTFSAGVDAGWLAQVTYVTNAPVITLQPVSKIVPMGTSIPLSVFASGAPPLSYQWLKNETNITGATHASFVLINSTRHDSGTYAVTVSNPGGTTLSSNAQVLVRVPQKLDLPVWLPQGGWMLLSGDADGQPLFTNDLTGFQAQFSTNLLDWTTVTNSLSLTNGALLLVDPEATNFRQGFYRVFEH